MDMQHLLSKTLPYIAHNKTDRKNVAGISA